MLKKVAFYATHSWQKVLLEPLRRFCQRELVCLSTGSAEEIIDFGPQVVFHSEEIPLFLRKRLPDTFMIGIGLHAKPKRALGAFLKRPDISCHPLKEPVTATGIFDGWQTGLPVMDILYQGLSPEKGGDKRKVVLYSPCADEHLSAHTVLGTAFFDLFMKRFPNLRVWIKPHPEVEEKRPEWVEEWWDVASCNPNVSMIDQRTCIFEVMPQTDLLISDFCDLYLYYLPLDRPVVLVNNPGRFESPSFYPGGAPWKYRHVVNEVENSARLLKAISRSLKDPSAARAARREVAGRLFHGELDGKASERILEKTRLLVSEGERRVPQVRRWLYRKRFLGAAASFLVWILPRISDH